MDNFDDTQRLKVLRSLSLSETVADTRLDAITLIAKAYFGVPAALVSLVDENRNWFMSRQGLTDGEISLDVSFANQVIRQDDPLIIPDAQLDERFADSEHVSGPPHIRFYAGAPIIIDGIAVGTLCIVDTNPGDLDDAGKAKLVSLAEMASAFLISHRDGAPDEYLDNTSQTKGRDTTLEAAVVARRESEDARQFLELILNNIPDLIFVKDAEFRHVQGNPAFFNLFPEDKRDSVIGMTGAEEINPEAVEAFQAKDREAFETGQSIATEQIAVMGGPMRTFQTKKIRFENSAGEPFLLAVARDVTDTIEAEQRLLVANAFQSLMFEHIPDLIFVKDAEFRIVEANQNFLNAYPEEIRDDVIGTTTIEQYNEEERDVFLEQDRIALTTGVAETEESVEFPDGERRVLFTKKVRFEDAQGDKFVLGIARDISELVEVRRQNEQSLELLSNVFDTVTGAVVGLDADKRVLMINDAGRHILGGITAEAPFDWPDAIEFLDPQDMAPLESSHDPIARAQIGQRIGGEVHLMTRAGADDTRYVRVTSALVQSQSSPLHTVIVLDDVSEAERNRQQIERQSRLDALGQLTGGIAHDFNNLLNTMQYALELIRRDELSERGERSANAALKSITRGAELTSRLLAFAKKQPARATARTMSEVLLELKALVDPAIEASITVEFPALDDDLMVFCDQGQLQNAVLNLILNSRDAIMQANVGHTIRLGVRAVDALPAEVEGLSKQDAVHSTEGRLSQQHSDKARADGQAHRYIEISVSDNGPGMSKAVVSRALDPFFTTKGTNSGTGLGLSMVYGFVQQSDGEIRIYTEEGEGTAVKLFLPRGSAETGQEGPIALAPLLEGNGETIFIVEDEQFLLEQLDELLRELNYKTVLAPSGRDAIKMIEDGVRVDLLLTDVVMPGGVGGFELARRARAIIPDIPIIYMSGYTGFTDEEMGQVVAPLLPKPSSPSMTSAQIRDVLDSKTKGDADG